ncbi:MAG: IS3 family transposase [Anaerolineales bacterium]|nr:IS3 family transposase [Anaerolineales bacterium]
MKYRYIEKNRERYPVKLMCRVFGITCSAYYGWKRRQPSLRAQANQALIAHIRRIHKLSRKTYGSPRVYYALKKQGISCSRNRVARLMRQNNLKGQRKYRKVRTTDSNHALPVAENVLNREFSAEKPDQKWVADITYIPTDEGWLYLAGVLDLYSRKIVGWAMSHLIDADLVEKGLRMVCYQRQPDGGLLHHSDRGSQYACHQIRNLLAANHTQVSMCRKANCWDNAVMESFWGTLKNEWVHHCKYKTRAEAKTDIFGYIEGF